MDMFFFKQADVFSVLKQYLNSCNVVIEAGSFWGHDTKKMACMWPEATIHAFEPIFEHFQRLAVETIMYKNIIVHQLALADKDEMKELFLSFKGERLSQAASFLKPQERLKHSVLTFNGNRSVQGVTLASFMQHCGIQQIDLLWLDLQGYEYAVLSAAEEVLPFVRVIHMEVYFIQAYVDHPLYEAVVNWIQTKGFTVVARDFEDTTKHFFGNIICVRTDCL